MKAVLVCDCEIDRVPELRMYAKMKPSRGALTHDAPALAVRRFSAQSAVPSVLAIVILAATLACGRPPQGSGVIASPSPTPSPSASTSPWQTFTDPNYQFTIQYPPGFTLQPQHGVPSAGLFMAYRVVDSNYMSGYPPGQIEIAIYSKDAATLIDWVTKHSGPPTSPDPTRYWAAAANPTMVQVGTRDGLSFDWVPDTGSRTVHATATFLDATNVLVLQWWSVDITYSTLLNQYYQQMRNELH
jgi:hypothetical protein